MKVRCLVLRRLAEYTYWNMVSYDELKMGHGPTFRQRRRRDVMKKTRSERYRGRALRLITAVFVTLMALFCPFPAFAYDVKGYKWGEPLEGVKDRLYLNDKKAVFNEKACTVVYTDTILKKECKVSLLFTPTTKKLAGIAITWNDPAVHTDVMNDLKRKYGPSMPYAGENRTREYSVWYSPTSRYDRVVVIGDKKRVVLGYYGGEFYKMYEDETKEASRPGSAVVGPHGEDH